MKKSWQLACAVIMLMLSACAYMENTHLQTAESLPGGKFKLQGIASTSYSFVPALPIIPDSLHTDYPIHRSYAMAIAYPFRASLGLGSGLEMGGQIFLYHAPQDKFPGYEETSFGKIATSGKAYLKMSFPAFKRKRISLAPARIINNGTIRTSKSVKYTYDIDGWEVPLTISFLGTDNDDSRGKSITLRYSELKTKGSIWARNDGSWSGQFYPNQPKRTIERFAIIYTYHFDQGKHRKYFDAGCECTYIQGNMMFTPVFGMSWELSSKDLATQHEKD